MFHLNWNYDKEEILYVEEDDKKIKTIEAHNIEKFRNMESVMKTLKHIINRNNEDRGVV